MCCFDPLRHLNRNANGLLHVQTAFFGDIALERNPLHKLHDDEMNIALVHNIVDIHDIRMRQTSCLSLHLEFADEIGVVRKFRLEHFDCHQTV